MVDEKKIKTFYRRRLPHWQPQGAAVFITWRLHGSLPVHVNMHAKSLNNGRDFVAFDELLDRPAAGPLWLSDPTIANLVAEAFCFGQQTLQLYRPSLGDLSEPRPSPDMA